MPPDLTRRATLIAAPAVVLTGAAAADPFAELERRSGGRLGVYARGPGFELRHRADERFPMCSTFKALLAACVLARVDAGREDLKSAILIPQEAVLSYAPVAAPAAKSGEPLTVEQLCAAAVSLSDNTAANVLLARIGGPAGLTAWLRDFDHVTRLDRTEPTLNECRPGDPRDTTSPAAMAASLRSVLFGEYLLKRSAALLAGWMIKSDRGLKKLRAGAPTDWVVGDKTGFNGRDTTNDVAFFLPSQGGGPIVIAAYLTRSTLKPSPRQEALFPEIAKIVVGVARG